MFGTECNYISPVFLILIQINTATSLSDGQIDIGTSFSSSNVLRFFSASFIRPLHVLFHSLGSTGIVYR